MVLGCYDLRGGRSVPFRGAASAASSERSEGRRASFAFGFSLFGVFEPKAFSIGFEYVHAVRESIE